MCAVSVATTPYEQHRGYVLSVLARRVGWLDRSDREALFHDAYALLLEKDRSGELPLDGMHPHQVRAYLVQTSLYKALDEGKRAERRRTAPMGDDALAAPAGGAPLEDALSVSLDNARVREIVDELPERRRTIVKLRYFMDCAPSEIQTLLGIRERVYRRELERAMRHIAERYELVRDGSYCESRRSLLTAYVAGLAGPNRAREAQAHIDTCPGCRVWAIQLRDAAQEVAAVLPLPALGDHHDALGRFGELLASLRDHVVDASTAAKHHATAVAARVDTGTASVSSALRPGTVAAAVAGCIAVGGGATYCVVQGLPAPVRSFISEQLRSNERHAERPKPPRAAAATTPATPPSSSAAQPTTSQPSTQPAAKPQPAPDPAEQEFGPAGSPAGSATPAQGSDPTASPATAGSAPAGSGSGGGGSGSSGSGDEFGP